MPILSEKKERYRGIYGQSNWGEVRNGTVVRVDRVVFEGALAPMGIVNDLFGPLRLFLPFACGILFAGFLYNAAHYLP